MIITAIIFTAYSLLSPELRTYHQSYLFLQKLESDGDGDPCL